MLGFRVWDVKKKKMITHNRHRMTMRGYLEFMHPVKKYDNGAHYYRQEVNPNKSLAISMQSTGLKDINGKEIFEGDGVFISCGSYEYRIIVENVVDFLRGHTLDHEGNIPELIILGNIYENPEFLEKVK